MLPPDDHVHSEWSWDTLAGDMERTCARAVEIGLPSVAFTEHADFSPYLFHDSEMSYIPSEFLRHMGGTTVLRQPEIDVDAYLACIERCRQRFPALRILTGVEISEPHWHPGKVAQLVAGNRLERVLASMHSRRVEGGARLLDFYFASESPHEVVRSYLEEILQMIEGSSVFQVLAHIDYPIRHWPRTGTAYQPSMFEEEHRAVLRSLQQTGRILEVNTRVPLHPDVVRWWFEAGGDAVTFASDAHRPENVGFGFAEAATMVEAQGFRPGRHPHDVWQRSLNR